MALRVVLETAEKVRGIHFSFSFVVKSLTTSQSYSMHACSAENHAVYRNCRHFD